MGYHHGDLRAALIDAGTALVAEGGLGALSVAEAARRTDVSAAAPYRHFPCRQDFVVAVAARAAQELDAAMRDAADAAGDDPWLAHAVAALRGVSAAMSAWKRAKISAPSVLRTGTTRSVSSGSAHPMGRVRRARVRGPEALRPTAPAYACDTHMIIGRAPDGRPRAQRVRLCSSSAMR